MMFLSVTLKLAHLSAHSKWHAPKAAYFPQEVSVTRSKGNRENATLPW